MNGPWEGASDGWFPLPEGWVYRVRRVVTRGAFEESFSWFPVPDPNGYAGIGLALLDKAPGAREYWMWTDESADRTTRIVRLGYRRYVLELRDRDHVSVVEDPRLGTDMLNLSPDERDVLGHSQVSSVRVLCSAVLTESCAGVWLNHGKVHDNLRLGLWDDE